MLFVELESPRPTADPEVQPPRLSEDSVSTILAIVISGHYWAKHPAQGSGTKAEVGSFDPGSLHLSRPISAPTQWMSDCHTSSPIKRRDFFSSSLRMLPLSGRRQALPYWLSWKKRPAGRKALGCPQDGLFPQAGPSFLFFSSLSTTPGLYLFC